MYAVVLAGTHERAVNHAGHEVPRPLLELDEEPLLTVLARRLSAVPGLRHIVVVTNEAIKPDLDAWARGLPAGLVPVRVVGDGTSLPAERKGAVGELIYSIDIGGRDDDVLVLAFDNWFTYDLSNFVAQSHTKSPAVVVTARRPGWLPSRYGMVRAEPGGRIAEFVEKPASSPLVLVATCVYYFGQRDLTTLDAFASEQPTTCSMGTFAAWLVGRGNLYAVEMTADWHDVGEAAGKFLPEVSVTEFSRVIRSAYHPMASGWERYAARQLQWVTSPEDLLNCIDDSDTNRRILAVRLLGATSHLISTEGRECVTSALLRLLGDGSVHDYGYAGSQSDEESAIHVSATAAEALAGLGYGTHARDVFRRAREAGWRVEERENTY